MSKWSLQMNLVTKIVVCLKIHNLTTIYFIPIVTTKFAYYYVLLLSLDFWWTLSFFFSKPVHFIMKKYLYKRLMT